MKRNSNIELLRFILMFMICVWHMFVVGMEYSKLRTGSISVETTLDFLPMSICVPAVNTFMLISGYYGMKFKIDKALRLIIQAFLLYLVYKFTAAIITGSFSLKYFLLHILPISTKNWWFLTWYFLIMVLSPILDGVNQISKKQFQIILIICFFINSVTLYILRQSSGYEIFHLLLIYLLGRYLNLHGHIPDIKLSLLGFLSAVVILYLATSYTYSINSKYTWQLFEYNNPVIILMSVCILSIFMSFPPQQSNIAYFLGKHSLAIYLLTSNLLYVKWASLYRSSFFLCMISILASLLLIEFIDLIQGKINDAIRKKININKFNL